MHDILVRTLRHEIAIPLQEPSPFSFLDARAAIEGGGRHAVTVSIEQRDGAIAASLPGCPTFAGSPRAAAAWLDRQIFSRAIDDEVGALALQSALLTAPERQRILLVGGRRTGKTMLAASLFAAGWMFEGDERAFLTAGGVTAHPRPLRVQQELLRFAPALAQLIDGAPSLDPDGKGAMFAVDPTRLGREWRISAGPIAAAFFLEPAGTRLVTLRRLNPDEAFARALHCSSMVHGITAAGIAALRSVLRRAPAFEFEFGCLDAAVDNLQQVLPNLEPASAY